MMRADPVRTELEAQALIAIRDTLALIDADEYPRLYKAREVARDAEDLASECEAWFDADLGPCPRCARFSTRVTFSDDWRVRCGDCGWSVRGDLWRDAADAWNDDGPDALSEEGDRCRSASA